MEWFITLLTGLQVSPLQTNGLNYRMTLLLLSYYNMNKYIVIAEAVLVNWLLLQSVMYLLHMCYCSASIPHTHTHIHTSNITTLHCTHRLGICEGVVLFQPRRSILCDLGHRRILRGEGTRETQSSLHMAHRSIVRMRSLERVRQQATLPCSNPSRNNRH